MESAGPIRYSIVIPLFNEQDNIRPLYIRILAAMKELSGNYEIVFVDDGSRDDTFKILSGICDADSHVTAIRLRKNFGQTAGLQAGFDHARGDIIISFFGRQYIIDPSDFPTGPFLLGISTSLLAMVLRLVEARQGKQRR